MSERKTDSDQARKIAREYVDRQIRVMQQNGLETEKVSSEEYESVVDDVASSIKR
jgi:hypothetical protein